MHMPNDIQYKWLAKNLDTTTTVQDTLAGVKLWLIALKITINILYIHSGHVQQSMVSYAPDH